MLLAGTFLAQSTMCFITLHANLKQRILLTFKTFVNCNSQMKLKLGFWHNKSVISKITCAQKLFACFYRVLWWVLHQGALVINNFDFFSPPITLNVMPWCHNKTCPSLMYCVTSFMFSPLAISVMFEDTGSNLGISFGGRSLWQKWIENQCYWTLLRYSGDLYSEHSNSELIWILNF